MEVPLRCWNLHRNLERVWQSMPPTAIRSYLSPHLEPRFQALTTVIDRKLLRYHPWQIVLATAVTLLLLLFVLDFIKGCTLGVQEKGKLFCTYTGSLKYDPNWKAIACLDFSGVDLLPLNRQEVPWST